MNHQQLLVDTINKFLEKGYTLRTLNTTIYDGYRPDAVMENNDETIIIEVVVSSDHTDKFNITRASSIFHKPARLEVIKPIRPKKEVVKTEPYVGPTNYLYVHNVSGGLYARLKKWKKTLKCRTWAAFLHEADRILEIQLKKELT